MNKRIWECAYGVFPAFRQIVVCGEAPQPNSRGAMWYSLPRSPPGIVFAHENTAPSHCRGGYQPPAKQRFLSGWLNGIRW